MSAHLRAGAVSGTECRRRSKGRGRRSEQRERGLFRALKMRPVGRCCFWHGTPLKMRRVPEEAFFGTEYLFCTGKACFAHRVPQKMPSVQKKGVFMHRMPFPYRKSLFLAPNASENASRTPGSLFEHGTHIPYRRWPSPVPNARHTKASCCRSGAWRTF